MAGFDSDCALIVAFVLLPFLPYAPDTRHCIKEMLTGTRLMESYKVAPEMAEVLSGDSKARLAYSVKLNYQKYVNNLDELIERCKKHQKVFFDKVPALQVCGLESVLSCGICLWSCMAAPAPLFDR